MSEIRPKTKSYPPRIKQKLISTPPSHNDNIKANPPPPPALKKSLLPSGTNITSNDSSTYVEESFEESSESLDSELLSSLHELGDSSSSTAPLALRFPRVWVTAQEFLSDWAFFFWSSLNHTVLYLPYFKFVSLLKFQKLGFSFC